MIVYFSKCFFLFSVFEGWAIPYPKRDFMTEEETQHYAIQAVLKAAIREDFISKLGKLKHSIGTYDRLIRATVPVIIEDNHEAKFFLLLSFDVGTDAKMIIENQLLPFIDKNIKMFK